MAEGDLGTPKLVSIGVEGDPDPPGAMNCSLHAGPRALAGASRNASGSLVTCPWGLVVTPPTSATRQRDAGSL